MKTIFVTSFEGVETRNLLRTNILSTILQERAVRVVVFTHDENRVLYHKKELGVDRITYEVVPKRQIVGINKVFSKLKFTLLNTSTKDVHRRMYYEKTKNSIQYYGGFLVNRIFARKMFRKLFRFLDYNFVKNSEFDNYFEKYNPSVVVLANLFNEPEIDFLRATKRHGVKSIGFINSWDKVTAKCILRLLPDKTIVFNNIVKDEVALHNDIFPKDIFVGGMPQYDYYFSRQIISREEFLKKRGFFLDTKFMVYAPLGSAFSVSDWLVIDHLYKLSSEGVFDKNIKILVRFPPHDFIEESELIKRPWLIYDHPGVRFANEPGGDWDMSFSDLFYLQDMLAHMSLLVGYASSINIDAAIFDKPVISIDFEIKPQKFLSQSPLRFRNVIHCKTLLGLGGAKIVKNEKELVFWINNYLQNPSIDKDGRRNVVEKQCVFMDGKSGERIGKFILSQV
jgi:hypothetical protein